ncbi:hypothetical protein HK096_007915 [Nowakowskiella sp. JEL0078]|nr:hypothetical protein HK096_007915 [Nowakowskiella sp. JEL0078]
MGHLQSKYPSINNLTSSLYPGRYPTKSPKKKRRSLNRSCSIVEIDQPCAETSVEQNSTFDFGSEIVEEFVDTILFLHQDHDFADSCLSEYLFPESFFNERLQVKWSVVQVCQEDLNDSSKLGAEEALKLLLAVSKSRRLKFIVEGNLNFSGSWEIAEVLECPYALILRIPSRFQVANSGETKIGVISAKVVCEIDARFGLIDHKILKDFVCELVDLCPIVELSDNARAAAAIKFSELSSTPNSSLNLKTFWSLVDKRFLADRNDIYRFSWVVLKREIGLRLISKEYNVVNISMDFELHSLPNFSNVLQFERILSVRRLVRKNTSDYCVKMGVISLREAGKRSSSFYKYDVMLSLSSKDEIFGRALEKILLQCKLRIWVYWRNMQGGMDKAMVEAINNSRIFMAIISPHYYISNECLFEIKTAISAAKRALLIKLPGEIPVDFRHYIGRLTYLELSNLAQLEEMDEQLKQILRAACM